MSDLDAEKKRLRAEARARRARFTADERQTASECIAAADLTALALTPGLTVAGYRAIGDEIDPAWLLRRLHAAGYRLALPAVRATNAALEFRPWRPGAPLQAGRWGIEEPLPEAGLATPKVIFMPLLAFDRTGARLGYGGGFYDRTLNDLRRSGQVTAIGLAFCEQEVDVVPSLDYDERLDWVLTPAGLMPCTGS